MPHPIAYLAFDGNCADAMRFYESALDAKLEMMMTNGQSPVANMCTPGTLDRVMHARLSLPGGGLLFAGDCRIDVPYRGIQGVSLTLNYDTTDEAVRVFEALCARGEVTMPMQPAFWAKVWGMCVDRYGTPWIVNGELLPVG